MQQITFYEVNKRLELNKEVWSIDKKVDNKIKLRFYTNK